MKEQKRFTEAECKKYKKERIRALCLPCRMIRTYRQKRKVERKARRKRGWKRERAEVEEER